MERRGRLMLLAACVLVYLFVVTPHTRDTGRKGGGPGAEPLKVPEARETVEAARAGRDEPALSYAPATVSAVTSAANAGARPLMSYPEREEEHVAASERELRLASARDPIGREDQLRSFQVLREQRGEERRQSVLDEARSQGWARLRADYAALAAHADRESQPVVDRLATAPARAQQSMDPRLSLAKLPVPAAPGRFLRQEQAAERIMAALERTTDPAERDSLQLPLAAAFVGAGQWTQAKAIYTELARSAVHESIRQTALLNLRILEGKPPGALPSGCGCPEPTVRPADKGGAR